MPGRKENNRRLSHKKYEAIRSFLEQCIQQFQLAEADNDTTSDHDDEDDLVVTAPLR